MKFWEPPHENKVQLIFEWDRIALHEMFKNVKEENNIIIWERIVMYEKKNLVVFGCFKYGDAWQ